MAFDPQSVNEPIESRGTGDISHRIEELRAELARLGEQVQNYLVNRADDVRRGAVETTAEVEGIVRSHPLPSIGIAFGAGLVLGLMLRRGNSQPSDIPRLSRRDFERLASAMSDSFARRAIPRAHFAPEDGADTALLERLAGALSGLFQASRSTAASVGSAGERVAKSVAAAGGKTARAVADRISHAAS